MLFGQVRNDARFGDGVRQRLFTVNVATTFQRRGRGNGVGVVGCANNDGINVFLLKELAKIVVGLRAGVIFLRGGEVIIVDVAERNDVLAGDFLQIGARAIGGADLSDVEFVVRRNFVAAKGTGFADEENSGGEDGGFGDELAACELIFHGISRRIIFSWFRHEEFPGHKHF